MKKKQNKLANELSPYLLQHANNPVDWHPWGEEAFKKAKEENKPVFLSIGYATCHWCHVMEHESFDDKEVAELMNQTFVNIKVDREERPDIDQMYMTVCQMLTGAGGWPLSIILTPDKKPFYAATYIPKSNRFNRPGMLQIIPHIAKTWLNEREKLVDSSKQITQALLEITEKKGGAASLPQNIDETALQHFSARFDPIHGGFGSSPKFPSPHNLVFVLEQAHLNKNTRAIEMVQHSLHKMRQGGIYDQIGFGFHRYSTDPQWLLPHFEKMLYDQALCLDAYATAYAVLKEESFKNTVAEIVDYLQREMLHPEGGFYSAEDADSEGEEGKYYVWSMKQLRTVLRTSDFEKIAGLYNMQESGNFTEQNQEDSNGNNIPHLLEDLEHALSRKELSFENFESIRKQLLASRDKRIHPLKDDKVLCSWNAMLIASLAKAAINCDEPAYMKLAENAMNFLESHFQKEDGSLWHRYRKEQVGVDAYAEDYAYMIHACLNLYQYSGKIKYLKSAIRLQGYFHQHFWGHKDGGYWFTSETQKDLPVRQKESYDGAHPSSNSVALHNLAVLFRITGEEEHLQNAEKLVAFFAGDIEKNPSSFAFFLSAKALLGENASEWVFHYNGKAKDCLLFRNALQDFKAYRVLIHKNNTEIDAISNFTALQEKINKKDTLYVCENFSCKKPVNEWNKKEWS